MTLTVCCATADPDNSIATKETDASFLNMNPPFDVRSRLPYESAAGWRRIAFVIDKTIRSATAAIAEVQDGATIMIGGFGVS